MKNDVLILPKAEEDIFLIFKYISVHNSVEIAEKVYKSIVKTILGLADFPDLGHVVPEMEFISNYDYKEIYSKPYRIIYSIENLKVYVHAIIDSRRNIQDILHERLIR